MFAQRRPLFDAARGCRRVLCSAAAGRPGWDHADNRTRAAIRPAAALLQSSGGGARSRGVASSPAAQQQPEPQQERSRAPSSKGFQSHGWPSAFRFQADDDPTPPVPTAEGDPAAFGEPAPLCRSPRVVYRDKLHPGGGAPAVACDEQASVPTRPPTGVHHGAAARRSSALDAAARRAARLLFVCTTASAALTSDVLGATGGRRRSPR